VLIIFLLAIPPAFPQQTKPTTPRRVPAAVRQRSRALSSLVIRQQHLEKAKQAGDESAIVAVSRQVTGLSLRQLGEIKLKQASAQDADGIFRRSLEFEDAPETHLDLARAYLVSGRQDDALSQVTNLLVSNPENFLAWRIQGQVWLTKKKYPYAVESLKHSADLQPDPYTSYLLGAALAHEKQRQAAKIAFTNTLHSGNRATLHALFSDAYREADYFDDADRELRQALSLDPKSSHAHYRRALLAMARNEWKINPSARAEFEKEFQLNSQGFSGNYALGLTEFFDQRYLQAQPFLRRAASARPNWPEPWLYLGLVAYSSGDPKSAEDHLQKAISLTSDDSRGNYQIRRAYYTLGRLLTEQNRKDEAAGFVSRFREIQAKMLLEVQRTPGTMGGGMAQMSPSASAFSALATTEAETSFLVPVVSDQALPFDLIISHADAAETEQEATNTREEELHRVVAGALNDLGTVEARQEQFTLALDHFHDAEKWHSETPGLMRNIGMAAARLSDYKETVRALGPVLAVSPSDTVARSMLGLALFSTDAFSEAIKVFAPLGDSVLDRPELAYAWASSLVKVNQFPQAASLLEKMQQRTLAPETLLLVAQTWSQMGNYPKAVEASQQALAKEPKLLRAHYIAGLALIHQDRPADAAQELRSELQLDSESTDAQFHLAFVLLQLSHNEEAVQWLRRVLARNPEHPEANYELGKELMAEGKSTDAIPYLETAARLKPQFEPVHYQLQSAYRASGRKQDADREATIYRDLKAKSRNITLPPPREQSSETSHPLKP
jgi:tetratricopeptide (TPR) repeat protein